MTKSATAIILTVALIFCFLTGTFPATAEDGGDPAARLREGLLACAPSVDLAGCDLPVSALPTVYAAVLYDDPALFYVALRLSYATAGGRVSQVYPVYTLTGEELTGAKRFFAATLGATLSRMQTELGGDSSEADRVLWLHDHLAHAYDYDTRATANADAYTFFRDGVGVCQAYALAFVALARAAGLEADFVSSAVMDHAWNHVRVDGVWYHVDVTRDDPVMPAGESSEVNHDRLLRSDAGMIALGYHGYICAAGHACTDTRFELGGKGILTGFHNPLTPVGGGWVGVDSHGAPVGVTVTAEGITVSTAGDVDSDGEVTPADLLAVYDPALPEAWRGWLRTALVREKSAQGD